MNAKEYLKMLREKAKPKRDKAEKIVIAYETPKISLKYVVLYREVDYLLAQNHYSKPIYVDEEGFLIGVFRERVYDDRQTFLNVVNEFLGAGWILEQDGAKFLNESQQT